MKLLFITALPLEINSSATLQNMALIKGFYELGYQIDLLTTKTSRYDANFDDSLLVNQYIRQRYELEIGEIYSSFRNNKKDNPMSKLKKAIKKNIGWIYKRWEIYDGFKSAVKQVKFLKFGHDHDYDLVISASDPKSSHLIAEEFIRIFSHKKVRWVQYWGDPMYLDITKKNFFRRRLFREEMRILQKADEIIYVSPMTYEKQMDLYPKEKGKMKFVPLGYIEEKITNLKHQDTVDVGYYGYYYSSARNIIPFYEATIKNNYKFRIVGEGDVKLNEHSNLEVLPRLNYNCIEKLEENTKILVCLCNSRSTQIPGKLYYYCATNKPILVILDGNRKYLKTYLGKFNRFVFCENDPIDINDKITQIINGEYSHLEKPVRELYCSEICKIISDKDNKGWHI